MKTDAPLTTEESYLRYTEWSSISGDVEPYLSQTSLEFRLLSFNLDMEVSED